jgi:hypothetical protein
MSYGGFSLVISTFASNQVSQRRHPQQPITIYLPIAGSATPAPMLPPSADTMSNLTNIGAF